MFRLFLFSMMILISTSTLNCMHAVKLTLTVAIQYIYAYTIPSELSILRQIGIDKFITFLLEHSFMSLQ